MNKKYFGVSSNDPTRYAIDDIDLHCGDSFKIKSKGKWKRVSIEKDQYGFWYFISDNQEKIDIPFHTIEAKF